MGDNNILQQQTSSNNWMYYDLYMVFPGKAWHTAIDGDPAKMRCFPARIFFFVWAIRPWVVLLFVKQWYQGLKMWKKSPNISFASKISFAKPFHTGLAKISAQHEHFPLVVCLNLAWPREATEWYQFSWWTRPFSDCRDPQILISIHPMCPGPSNLSSLWSQNRSLVSGLPFRWFATNISTFISLIRYDKPRSYSKSKNKKSAWPTFILFFLLNPGEVWISIQTKAPWALFWRFGHWEKIGTELLVQRLPELLRSRCH